MAACAFAVSAADALVARLLQQLWVKGEHDSACGPFPSRAPTLHLICGNRVMMSTSVIVNFLLKLNGKLAVDTVNIFSLA